MKTFSITQSSIFLLSAAISTTAFGAGYALNEQSAASEGQALSGRASDAADASTLVGNPAGMSLLKQAEISGGFIAIDAHSDIKNASGSVGGTTITGSNDGDMIPFTNIPFGYYVQPLDPHWAVGLGVYVPFGLTTDYENGFQGRYFGTKSYLRVITTQPTVSYRFDNGVSIGGGVTYNRLDGELDKNIYNPLNSSSDIAATVKGDDDAWGYNIGILYEISDKTRIGLTYFSQVDYKLEGHTNLNNIPTSLGLGNSQHYDASLNITTPDKIDFGFTHELAEQWTLHGDVTRTNWSTMDSIVVHNAGAPTSPADLSTSSENLKWDPSWFYSLGLSYALNQQWTLRGGLAYDQSPIPDSTRSVRVPSANRKELGLGATWAIQKNLSVDFSYLYFREDTANVDMQDQALVTHAPINYSAKYENHANLVGAQVNWKF